MLAMMRTSPPHSLQVSMSMSKTRLSLCAHWSGRPGAAKDRKSESGLYRYGTRVSISLPRSLMPGVRRGFGLVPAQASGPFYPCPAGMERESCHLAYRIYQWIIWPAVRQGLQREHFTPLLWAHRNAVSNRPLLRVPAPAALVSPFTSTSQQMIHR